MDGRAGQLIDLARVNLRISSRAYTPRYCRRTSSFSCRASIDPEKRT